METVGARLGNQEGEEGFTLEFEVQAEKDLEEMGRAGD